MNLVFIDIETTGVDPSKHSIIQIAAEFHIDGKKVSSFNKKCRPKEGSGINLGAYLVNKARIHDMSHVESRNDVLNKFVNFLLDCKQTVDNAKIYVCGHSIDFDIKFIREALSENNIEGLESILFRKRLDTQILAESMKIAGIIKPSSTSLGNLIKYFKIDKLEEGQEILGEVSFHEAAFDVAMTAKLYYTLIDILKNN